MRFSIKGFVSRKGCGFSLPGCRRKEILGDEICSNSCCLLGRMNVDAKIGKNVCICRIWGGSIDKYSTIHEEVQYLGSSYGKRK